jgi:hypothetical protein
MKVLFTVVTCKPNQKEGFVFKLETVEDAKAFGMTKSIKRTYYIGGMPAAVNVGAQFEEELSNFEIKERAYVVDVKDEDDNPVLDENDLPKQETIWLKWLHVKSTVDRNTRVVREA